MVPGHCPVGTEAALLRSAAWDLPDVLLGCRSPDSRSEVMHFGATTSCFADFCGGLHFLSSSAEVVQLASTHLTGKDVQ